MYLLISICMKTSGTTKTNMGTHDGNISSLAVPAAQKYLSLVKGAPLDTWMDIWAGDAIVEFPYAPDTNPRRLEGKDAIYDYYKNVIPALELREEGPLVTYPSSDPRVGIFEISLGFFIRSTKKVYNQDYIGVVKVHNDGRIIFYREYWDTVRAQEAFRPDGVGSS